SGCSAVRAGGSAPARRPRARARGTSKPRWRGVSHAAPGRPARERGAMANRERPLSPHIQVYRWQITMTMSILHRTSGIILFVGAFALAWWLLAVAAGGDVYAAAAACVASPVGMIA